MEELESRLDSLEKGENMHIRYVVEALDVLAMNNTPKEIMAKVAEQMLIEEENAQIRNIKKRTHQHRKALSNRFKMSNEMYDAENPKQFNLNEFPHGDDCNCGSCLTMNSL